MTKEKNPEIREEIDQLVGKGSGNPIIFGTGLKNIPGGWEWDF